MGRPQSFFSCLHLNYKQRVQVSIANNSKAGIVT